VDRRDFGAGRRHTVDRSEGMSGHGGPNGGSAGQGLTPSDADLATASRDELVRLGLARDGVTITHLEDPFPVPGTRAQKRTERAVAWWFIIAALAGLGFLAAYLFWPFEYVPPDSPGDRHLLYTLYTPIVGVLFGLSVFAIGGGTIAYAKRLLPHETAVQERHIGGSAAVDRVTTSAILADSAARSGIGRRSAIKRAAGYATRGRAGTTRRCGSRRGARTTVSRSSSATTPSKSLSHALKILRPGASRRCSRTNVPGRRIRRTMRCGPPTAP
jgi:hypothetical protein